jgi:hypothetical protein
MELNSILSVDDIISLQNSMRPKFIYLKKEKNIIPWRLYITRTARCLPDELIRDKERIKPKHI